MPLDLQTHDQVLPFFVFIDWHVDLVGLATQWILLTELELHVVNRDDVGLGGLCGGQDVVAVDRTAIDVEALKPYFHSLERVVEGYFDAG